MREILFRAKRIDNGEWVEGVVFPPANTLISYQHELIDGVNTFMDFCVLPETIGQYTGLTDKNGKKIFEGDVVDVEYDIQYVGVGAERIGLFVVVFDDGCFMKQRQSGGLYHFIPSDKCNVIGNIYDNPELMRKEDEK